MWKSSFANDQSPAIVGGLVQSNRFACSSQNAPGLLDAASYSVS